MAESKAQFRERIGMIAENRRFRYPAVANTPAAHWDAAEAVYAEALRDVIALHATLPVYEGLHPDDIRRYASSLGLDLEDAP